MANVWIQPGQWVRIVANHQGLKKRQKLQILQCSQYIAFVGVDGVFQTKFCGKWMKPILTTDDNKRIKMFNKTSHIIISLFGLGIWILAVVGVYHLMYLG